LENVISRKKYLFKCNKWLAVDEDDHQIERDLIVDLSSSEDKSKKRSKF
jgi:hypothetical protein